MNRSHNPLRGSLRKAATIALLVTSSAISGLILVGTSLYWRLLAYLPESFLKLFGEVSYSLAKPILFSDTTVAEEQFEFYQASFVCMVAFTVVWLFVSLLRRRLNATRGPAT
jgi:hypothetical protein